MIYKIHDEFVEKYGEEPLEMVSEALWHQQKEYSRGDKKIMLGSVIYSDAINCIGLAEYEFGKDGYVEFSFRSGNVDGFTVESFGENTEWNPTRSIPVFALDVNRLESLGRTEEEIGVSKKLFSLKAKEINEMQGKMQYDFYFSPTTKIFNHYKNYANKMFLKIEHKTISVDY